MSNVRSTLPHFDVFGPSAAPALSPAVNGLGKFRLFALSPVVAAVRGLGQDPATPDACLAECADRKRPMTASDIAGLAISLGLVGALSYQVGKAIAPSREDRSTWGLIGVPVGLFTGAIGLGVMGIVANQRKA